MAKSQEELITEASERLLVVERELIDQETAANVKEEEARQHRATMVKLKDERRNLTTVLNNARVVKNTVDAQAAAAKAKSEAESSASAAAKDREEAAKSRKDAEELLKRLEEKEKALDAKLAG